MSTLILLIQLVNAQNPGGVAGTSRWYRADTGVTTGALMTWADQSGNSVNVTQGTAANQPVYNTSSGLINFNPKLTFDGTSDRLNNASGGVAFATGAYTVYYVAASTATATTPRWALGFGASSNLNGFNSGLNTAVTSKVSGGATFVTQTNQWSSGMPSLTRTGYNGGTTQPYYLSSNGVTETTSTNVSPNISTTPFSIGARPDGTANFWQGDVSEVIIYPGKHTATDYDKIETYLALKYGLTKSGNYVASNGTVIYNDATYNNNIAGIARDGALHQRQSQSQNSGIQPVIGNNSTILASNTSGAGNFATDSNMMLWGSDTGNTSFTTAFVFGGLNNRMQRIWKIQETGTVGTVKVALPANQIATALTKLNLVVSSDATFDGTDTRLTMTLETIGGISYYTTTVDLTNGQFFTFAGLVTSPGGVLNGLGVWFKADAGITLVSGAVDSWANLGNAASLASVSAPAAANRPVYSAKAINFNPSLQSTNDDMYLQKTSGVVGSELFSTTAYSFYTAAKWISGDNVVWHYGDTGNRNGYELGAASNFFQNDASTSIGHPSTPNDNLVISSRNRNGASFLNFISGNTSTTGANVNVNLASTTFRIMRSSGGFGFTGLVPEVVAYNRSLSTTEQQSVQSYLALKYGVSLGTNSSTFNYVLSSGTTIWTGDTTYQNNIAGIVRDDASGLNQKQSTSMNTGIQPAIGNANITDTNANNTNNFSADSSAMIWGSSTASTTFNTAFSFGTSNTRMQRIWKVQETGTVGTVKVALPASQIAENISQFNLVVSNDAVFNGSDTRIAMTSETIGGVDYYTATVDFTNGQFFTFSGLNTCPGGVYNGLVRWYSADVGASAGTWIDRTGNANATQTTAANQPSYNTSGTSLINFNPSLTFNSSQSDYYTFNDADMPSGSNPRSTFGVARTSVVGGTFEWITSYGNSTNTNNFGLMRSGNNLLITTFGTGNDFYPYNTNNPYESNTPVLSYGAASGSTVYGTYNALPVLSATHTVNTTPTAGRIGTRQALGEYWNGIISEVIYYSTIPTAVEKQKIDSYLGIKYGTSLGDNSNPFTYLASNGTTIWTGSSTYQNNIAGIARDDASGLNQKQSVNVNTGIQPVIGNTNITSTNANNTNNFSANFSALIWGSDTGSTSFATAFAFGGLNNRMTRVWRVQESGTVGTVKVALPANQIAGIITQLNLVVSSDATFDNSDTRIAMVSETLGGVSYYTATVDFTTGQFFSFAALVTTPGGVASGLKIWHKADTGVTSTSNAVTAWNNLADNRQVINTTATQRPTLTQGSSSSFNFNPYLNFTVNTNTLYDAGATPFTADGNITYFTAMKPESTATNGQFFAVNLTPATTGGLSYDSLEWLSTSVYGSPGASLTYGTEIRGSGLSIFTFHHNGSTNRMSGFQNLTTLLNNVTSAGDLGTGGYVFGSDASFAGGGQVAPIAALSENIAYDRVLSATEIQRVQTYLAIKSGVTLGQNYLLSNGTTNIWNATTNAGYLNNIAGIGRDDTSGLHQKVSRSINKNSVLTLATTTNFTAVNSDASRTAVANNLSFLVIGDDNATVSGLSTTNTATSLGYNVRVPRLWRVQNTSFNQNVSLYFSGVDISSFNFYLVWDANGNFTDGNSVNLGQINVNSFITVAGSSLPNGYLALMSTAPDSDNDGVINFYDLDDDNDGILDEYEANCSGPFNAIAATAAGATATYNGFNATYTLVSGASTTDIITDIFGYDVTAHFTNTPDTEIETLFSVPIENLDYVFPDFDGAEIVEVDFYDAAGNLIENITPFIVHIGSGIPNANVTSPAGMSIRVEANNFGAVAANDERVAVRLKFNIPISRVVWRNKTVTTNYAYAAILSACLQKDTDNDNVNDQVDLDSDNDGCPDYIEGSGGFSTSNGVVATGSVTDGNGNAVTHNLGNTIASNGIPTVAGNGQTSGASQISSVVACYAPGGVFNGLQRWHKSNIGVTVATGVSAWTDQNAATILTQGTVGNQPLYNTSSNLLNFNPSIRFDGSNDRLNNGVVGLPLGATASTFYFVDSPTATNTSRYVFGYGATSGTASFQAGPAGTFTSKQGGGSQFATQTSAYAVNQPSLTRTGYDSTKAYLSHNGSTEQISTTYTQNISTTAFAVGSRSDAGANYFTGDIPEVIAYSGKNSASELIRIESYLAIKYGIPKSGNYQSSNASVIWTSGGGYDNNIAGIGRDDVSTLNQKQAQSQNKTQTNQVIFGLGSVATTNAANSNTFSSDRQFLLWGDNNATGTIGFTDPSDQSVFARLARTWFVDNSNSYNHTTQLLIPVALTTGSSSAKLVMNTSSTFASATNSYIPLSATTTVSSVSYYVVNLTAAQVANDFYFSIILYQTAPGGVVSGLQLWMKANDGWSATNWVDRSPNAFTASKVGSPTQTKRVNFHPSVSFGNGNYYSVPHNAVLNQNALNQMTVAAVFNTEPYTYNGFFAKTSNTTWDNGWQLATEDNTTSNRLGFCTGDWSGGSPSNAAFQNIPILRPAVAFGYSTGNTGQANFVSISGKAATQSTGTVNTQTNTSAVTIGSANGYQYIGDITEVIMYNQNNAADKSKIDSYLAIKYGITLDQTTPNNYVNSSGTVVWNATSNSGYKNDITGISRDDFSALNQVMSKSVNSNAEPVLSLTSVPVTSLNDTHAATNVFDNNNQSLVWGNNATRGFTDFTNPIDPNITHRLSRVWKAQTTNYNISGDDDIAFNFTKGSLQSFINSGTNYYLVLSTTSDFSANNYFIQLPTSASNIDGTDYLSVIYDVSSNAFSGVTSNGTFYFTIAGKGTGPGGVLGIFWNRADKDVVTSGSNVSKWTDQMFGIESEQVRINTNLPALGTTATFFNFNPYLDFTNTNQSLGNEFVAPCEGFVNDVEHFFITKDNAYSGRLYGLNYDLKYSASGGAKYDWNNFNNDGYASRNNTAGGGSSSTAFSPASSTTLQNMSHLKLSPASTNLGYRLNGSTVTNTSNSNYNYIGQGGFIYGANNQGGLEGNESGVTAQIAEHLIVGRTLTATERRQIESYLGLRYGITLSDLTSDASYRDGSGNPTFTTDATYKYDIFGIAKEAKAGINQRISKSINNDAGNATNIITVSTDTNYTNMNSTHTDGLTDGQYLIFASNNSAVAFTGGSAITATDGTAFSATEVLATRWKVQDKGSVGCINMRFNNAAFTAVTGSTKYYFITADNAAFTQNVIYKEVTRDASNNIDVTVNFGDNTNGSASTGNYFTIGRKNLSIAATNLAPTKTGINTIPSNTSWTPTLPNTYLEINSNGKGVIVSRVNGTGSITAPVEGMIIFDLSDSKFKVYTGTIWRELGSSGSSPTFCN